MRKQVMAITYQPKIKPVQDGRCTQTIRKGHKVSVGDIISFYMYNGRWISKCVVVNNVEQIIISQDVINFYDNDKLDIVGKSWSSFFGTSLAIHDFIDPPTGEALRDVLFGFYGVPDEPEEYQIIRWW